MGRSLKVQAAQRSLPWAEGDVALRHSTVQPARLELASAERAGEEAALVLDRLGFDEEGAAHGCLDEDHGMTCKHGIGMTKRPPQARMPSICAMISSLRFHGRMNR